MGKKTNKTKKDKQNKKSEIKNKKKRSNKKLKMSSEPNTIIGYKYVCLKTCMVDYGFLVTLEIPLENNANNMNRSSIVDRQFAKMRCQKAKVLKIENMYSGESLPDDFTCYSQYDNSFAYKKDEIVSVSNFDTDIDNVCAAGIHFFLSIEAVHYYDALLNLSTFDSTINSGNLIPVKKFDNNGRLLVSCEYLNGKRHGNYLWNDDENISFKGTFNNGKRVGIFSFLVENCLTCICDYSSKTVTIYNDDGITKYADILLSNYIETIDNLDFSLFPKKAYCIISNSYNWVDIEYFSIFELLFEKKEQYCKSMAMFYSRNSTGK